MAHELTKTRIPMKAASLDVVLMPLFFVTKSLSSAEYSSILLVNIRPSALLIFTFFPSKRSSAASIVLPSAEVNVLISMESRAPFSAAFCSATRFAARSGRYSKNRITPVIVRSTRKPSEAVIKQEFKCAATLMSPRIQLRNPRRANSAPAK